MTTPPAEPRTTARMLLAEVIDAAAAGHALGVLRAARDLADQLQAGATPPADPRG